MSETEAAHHRPQKRRGDHSNFDDDELSSNRTASSVEDRRIVITTEQFVSAVLHDKARTDEFFCQAPGCTQVFNSTKDYNAHYLSKHMYKCDTCRKEMPGSHLLELHVLENHDTLFSLMAEKKPMFACLAEECLEKWKIPQERYSHFHTDHKGHPMFGAFVHFERIHSPQRASSCSNGEKQGSRQRNKNSSKFKTKSKNSGIEMEVVDPNQQQNQDLITDLVVDGDHQKSTLLEIMDADSEETVSTKGPACLLQKPGSSKKTSPENKVKSQTHQKPKSVPSHITFGHHGQKNKFRPWHSTQGQTGSQSHKQQDVAAAQGTGVETMDLSSIQNALDQHEDHHNQEEPIQAHVPVQVPNKEEN